MFLKLLGYEAVLCAPMQTQRRAIAGRALMVSKLARQRAELDGGAARNEGCVNVCVVLIAINIEIFILIVSMSLAFIGYCRILRI